ncbi:MAG TPA: excinuclease ABC subunit B [Flavobacterium sp.]|jgi:hypothetical protein|nr:excinuclease ABC subunit B [Flavobacterium sp.]
MHRYVEKISLLTEMISFAIIDGKLHEREYLFLRIVASELGISKKELDDLFHQELKPYPIKSEFQRIQQFYRLALLMHVDGVLHEKEEIAIQQIALNMGLNPNITKRILKMLQASPTKILEPNVLLEVFREQHN